MNAIELLNNLTKYATQYRADASASLERNNHMNKIEDGEIVQQRHIDAVLVDFINFIGIKNCIDYALYTSDIQKEAKKEMEEV